MAISNSLIWEQPRNSPLIKASALSQWLAHLITWHQKLCKVKVTHLPLISGRLELYYISSYVGIYLLLLIWRSLIKSISVFYSRIWNIHSSLRIIKPRNYSTSFWIKHQNCECIKASNLSKPTHTSMVLIGKIFIAKK